MSLENQQHNFFPKPEYGVQTSKDDQMKNLAKKCEKIFEKDGLCGVIDYCNSIDHQEWGHCDQCDSENPILENYCLACGSRANRGFDNNGEYV